MSMRDQLPSVSSTRWRLATLVAATAAATLAHLMALAAGADMLLPAFDADGTQQLSTVGVAASAAVATLLGWAVAWAAGRFTRRPRRVWLILALAGLAGSFVPVEAIEATGPTKAVLAAQHLLVAAMVIPVFARTLLPRRWIASASVAVPTCT